MKKLLYTTHNDLSLELFVDWQVRFYDDLELNADISLAPVADVVYFRDPFNDPNYQPPNPTFIDRLIKSYQGAKVIDHLTGFQDIIDAEDKYRQAEFYAEWSPRTWLPSQHQFTVGQNLAKPRISQRAKNILFNPDGRILDDSWIIQELLDIREELRVYTVFGEIINLASIKSSKSSGSVKIIGVRELEASERQFIQDISNKCQLDVVGYDIAILTNGQFKMIEANRSPQFKRFTERTGINLATVITGKLEKKA